VHLSQDFAKMNTIKSLEAMADLTMEKMLDYAVKLQDELKDRPRGLICSERTEAMLKRQCESISGDQATSIMAFTGIPLCVEPYFPDDQMLVLDKEKWDIYRKEGMVGLFRHMAMMKRVKCESVSL